MKRLRVGVLELVANRTSNAWFDSHVMLPTFASIMPQCVAVWAEELGCEVFYDTYTGREDLEQCLPKELDVLFLSCFSRASYLAYAVSTMYRQRGTVTVMGGPHARSFAQHALPYFDFVCQLTDKATVQSLLRDRSHHAPGLLVDAQRQPTSLPGVRARARFIDRNIAKNDARRFVRTVPMLGSVGCPYTCHFCIDATIPYQTLPQDELLEDLRFAQSRYGQDTLVFWHDPNFGVRFEEYMGLIEESGTQLFHGGETSLSLLSEPHLRAMQRNRWMAQFPGIESWYEFNGKGAAHDASGLRKVEIVAEHLNMVQRYIPYVQANFVLGLDSDAGDEPFELTKRFVDLAPGIFPGYSLITDFKNSPLSAELARQGRTFDVPHPFLDNNFAFNVRLKNYALPAFYDRLIDLQAHTWGWGAIRRRFQANRGTYVKIANIGRALTEGRWRWNHFRRVRKLLDADAAFLRWYNAEQPEPPQYYFDVLAQMLGTYAKHLPRALTTPTGFLETALEASVRTEERTSPSNPADGGVTAGAPSSGQRVRHRQPA